MASLFPAPLTWRGAGLLAVACGVLLLALALLIDGGPSKYIHIRWRPGVNDARRGELESRFGLRERVRDGRSFGYDLVDLFSSNVRAIITDPEVIIADEPTGNLDYEAGENLLKLLRSLNDSGKTIIMVTHDLEYLSYAKTALSMRDGKVLGMFRGAEKAELERGLHSKRGINPQDIAGTPNPESDFPDTTTV